MRRMLALNHSVYYANANKPESVINLIGVSYKLSAIFHKINSLLTPDYSIEIRDIA